MTKRKDKVNGNWLHLSLLNNELRNILGSRFSSFVSRPRHQLETISRSTINDGNHHDLLLFFCSSWLVQVQLRFTLPINLSLETGPRYDPTIYYYNLIPLTLFSSFPVSAYIKKTLVVQVVRVRPWSLRASSTALQSILEHRDVHCLVFQSLQAEISFYDSIVESIRKGLLSATLSALHCEPRILSYRTFSTFIAPDFEKVWRLEPSASRWEVQYQQRFKYPGASSCRRLQSPWRTYFYRIIPLRLKASLCLS